MCGIGGKWDFSGKEVLQDDLRRMNDLMVHRGPDGEGFFIDGSLGLCHRRLKILDLSDKAKGPMVDHSGRFVLTYNGECYNYKELRDVLQKNGITFRTSSDTEVVLEALGFWGVGALSKMNGMFALGLWDKKEKKLLLARDRLGIKPLYIHKGKDSFLFASEIKPLLASGVEFQLDTPNLYDYLTLRYVPTNKTLFRGVESVNPGTYMVVHSGGIEKKRYWRLRKLSVQEKFSPEILLGLISSSVKYRLSSDVPLGCFLSGGLDSGFIAERIRDCGRSVDTFGFDIGGRHSETGEAQVWAKAQNHNFHHFEGIDFNNLEQIFWFLEEPLGDSIILPSFSLFQGAARRVKVSLSGEGADEIFNGYVHHIVLYLLHRLGPARKQIARWANLLPVSMLNYLHPYPQNLDMGSLKGVLHKMESFDSSMRASRDFVRLFSWPELREYLHPDILHQLRAGRTCEYPHSFLDSLTLLDLEGWNCSYTLHRLDRLSMAVSLEARVPFLDHRIVEYVINLSDRDRLGFFSQKKALRRAAKAAGIPKSLWAKKKRPFHLPLRGKAGQEFNKKTREYFSHLGSGIWNLKKISKLIQKSTKRSFVEDKQLFCFLALEVWFQVFKGQQRKRLTTLDRRK